jgi:hypothetical protein
LISLALAAATVSADKHSAGFRHVRASLGRAHELVGLNGGATFRGALTAANVSVVRRAVTRSPACEIDSAKVNGDTQA